MMENNNTTVQGMWHPVIPEYLLEKMFSFSRSVNVEARGYRGSVGRVLDS